MEEIVKHQIVFDAARFFSVFCGDYFHIVTSMRMKGSKSAEMQLEIVTRNSIKIDIIAKQIQRSGSSPARRTTILLR
jgi:hypothetical protein